MHSTDDTWKTYNQNPFIHVSLEVAKAAAQADYETRVLSALAVDPPRTEEVPVAYGSRADLAEIAKGISEPHHQIYPKGYIGDEVALYVAAPQQDADLRKAVIEEVAAWIEPQRNDVPMHGWEAAAAIRALAGGA